MIEVERYELFEAPFWTFEIDRRDFLKAAAGGIAVFWLLDEAAAQDPRRRGGAAGPADLGAWLQIDEKGQVTVYTGKTEVGQNIRTSLAQVVAEELRVPLESIRMVMADTDLCPPDGGTAGSRTTPSMSPQLRKVAATARELLLDRAAADWKVDRATLTAADGKIQEKDGARSASFGELTKGQKLAKAVGDAALTPTAQWKVAGAPAPKANGRDIVTGAHQYASDIRRPGMLFGRVLRPPSFGATLASVDLKPAGDLGAIVLRDGDFVGVAAATPHAATKALEALRPEWKTVPQPAGKDLFERLRKDGPGRDASVDDALKAAEVRVERTYTVPYIAHAPMEPRAAVAEWKDGKLTVWTGTQQPFRVRGELARSFGLGEDKVRVIVPDTGGGFGGKHTAEAALEAARLAKSAAKPVKVQWTREEEFTWAYFRPAGVLDVRAGASKDGRITAWDFHNFNSGGSSIRAPYDLPNQKAQFHNAPSPLRQGSYRALASTANSFARESVVDELARELKMDPLEFRLKNLKDGRMRAVLEAAAAKFGWERREKGSGLACSTDKGSVVATCAQIRLDGGKIKVVRAVTAFECGAIINPDHLRNQVEGAVTMGIGGALFEAIEFDQGKILNPRFSLYRVPRAGDVPVLETVLLDRKDQPSAGAGETPIIAIAPAIANALCDLTGERRRSLPL